MRRLALALLLLLSLNACESLGVDDWFAVENGNPVDEKRLAELNSFPFELMAPQAPPQANEEIKPPKPMPADEYDWRPGHWEYVDNQGGFQWREGYWIRKPAFTAVWAPDFWIQRTYGWSLVPGHWE